MSNVIHFRSAEKKQQAIREQACLWVVKLSAGPSSRELEEIHVWLDENPEHVKALLSVACLWDQVSVLSELSDIFPLDEYVPRPPPPRRGLAYSALAVFLVIFFLQTPLPGWLEARWQGQPSDLMQLSYETRIGQQSTVVLTDGSEVLLNTNSRIEVSFSTSSRDIILHRGEAQFTVTKDKARPFRVHANGGIVEAVGTMFTVQETPEKTLEVTVIEGIVNFTRTREQTAETTTQQVQLTATESAQVIAPAAKPIPLEAGESLHVEETSDTILKQTFQPEELETRLAWREGMLLFEGDPLEEVIYEVSRYTSIRIDVDENVRDIAVLGYFRTGDVEGVLLAMQNTFNLKVERPSKDHIVLTADDQQP